MQPLYGQDGTTIIGYSYTNGYAIWTYSTSWQAQGITLDAAAISSGALSPVLTNSVTTGYTYTDTFGTLYTYNVDTNGAVTGYTSTYSGLGYSYTYNFDALGAFNGYSHFDGTTTTTYDANWTVVSTVTVVASNMVAILDAGGATIGYSVTDEWGTATNYALDRVTVTGYSYTYVDTVNNTTSVSTYDANWNYLGSETKGTTTGVVLYSNSYSYDANGAFTGYTYFDGVTTTVYDANWNVVSSTASTANLTSDGAGGFYSTDAWGTTTTYDSTGQVTGYRYSYTNWDNSVSVTTYDASWNYIGSETRDAQNNLLYSNAYTYVNGIFSGYTYFDGVTTTVYDANWNVISSTANIASLTQILDANNQLIGYSKTDEWGTTTTYDTAGVLTGYSYRYTNWDNSVSVTAYDANWNYLSSETRDAQDKLLYSNSYSYDANGVFTGYTYFDGVTTTIYDANWNVVSSTASTAGMTQLLDANSQLIGYSHTDQWGTTTTYDLNGQVTGYRYSYTNWDNSVSVTTYDANWNYIGSETRDAQNNLLYSNSYSYDANGVFTGYTYFDGVTTTVYDANWNVVSSIASTAGMTQLLDANSQLIGYSHTDQWGTTTTYDLNGQVTGYRYSYTNWDNSVSVTTYDANWTYIGSETRDAQNNLLYSNSYSYDANGVFTGYTYFDGVTTTVYDANWNVVSSTASTANLTPDGAGGFYSTDAWGTTTTYDSIGQVTGYRYSYTNWDNSVSVTTYDASWNYIGSETRDAQNNLLYSNSYSYDANGAFTRYTYFDGVTTTVYDANWNVVSSTVSTAGMTQLLDANSQLIGYSHTDQWGTTTTYDLSGFVTSYRYSSVDSAHNTTTVTTYDKNWYFISSVTTDNTSGAELYRSEYSYDTAGAFNGYTYFDGITTTVYDAGWNVVSSTVSTANMIQVFDASNQLTGYRFTDAWGTTTYYDTNNVKTGSVYTYVDTWNNTTTVTTYGASGNYLSSETKNTTTDTVLSSSSYSYDQAGNFTGYTSFDGVTTTVYNSNWQVVSSTTSIANLTEVRDAGNVLTGYTYTDVWGTTTYYDTTGMKTGSSYSYTNWDGTKSISHYDKNGSYTGWSNTDAQGNVLSSSLYNYDQQGNYAGYTYFDGVITTVYDAAGAVIGTPTIDLTRLTLNAAQDGYYRTDASGTTTYYDLQGAKTGSSYSYTNWDGTKSISHYDANGSYTGWSNTDAQGNVLSSSLYNYDLMGAYIGYTSFDGFTTTVYDTFGMFVSSSIDLTKLTLNAAQDGYYRTDASGTTTYYDLQGAKTGSSYSYANWDGTKSVSHYDANGSYIGWSNTDAQGKVLSSSMYNYDQFGSYAGYTYFDGITTTVYDANGYILSATANTANMTQVLDANNVLVGYSHTDTYGTTTYYDTLGVKTGSSYSYTYADGTKSLSHYDASGSYIGWSNTDALGKVLSSSMYNYDQFGSYAGYTYFDGITTTVYDANWNVLSATANTANMTQVLDATGSLIGYSHTDQWGTTTYYDTLGAKTGSSSSYTNWDGTISHSHYNVSGSYIGWSNTDAQGNVLSSSMYNYDQFGSYAGYTSFDGVTTTVYDASGYVLSSTADITGMTQVLDANNSLIGYSHIDAYGTTTYYDLQGVKTGSSYTYTNWDGTKSISHYNATGSYIGWSNTDAQGNVLNSSLSNYDQQGTYLGYTYFDGITTTVYDVSGAVIGTPTVNTAGMTQVLDANNVPVGYSYTDAYGTTSTYDLNGIKTGYSYTYHDSWNNTTYVSTYKADGTFLKSISTAANGTVLYSEEYLYNLDGTPAGRIVFDGANTFTYDASGALLTDVGPYPISMALTGNGMTMDLSEVAYLPTDPITTLAFTMLKNGVTVMNINGFTGDGTASMTVTTDQTLAAGDWVLMNYTGSTVADGIRDAAGNVMLNNAQPGYGGSAEGSTGDNVINLSNTTIFSATGGYDISGGLGNDTITGSAAFDWIMGGAGADILTGGTTGDHFSFVQDGSGLVSYSGGVYAAANIDRITDFSTGDTMSLNVADSFAPGSQPQGLSMMSVAPPDGLAVDQGFFLVQGNYSAGQFTVNATTGADTMVVYDSDATAGVSQQSGIVLSGVTVGQLGAMAGSSNVSYMGGGITPPPPPTTGSAVTLDTNPGDTLIGTFSPYQGTTVALHDRTGPDGIIDSMDMTRTWTDLSGQQQSRTDTFAVQWDTATPTNWVAYRVDTLSFGTTYDAYGRPLTVMTPSGPQTITWLAVAVNNVLGTMSFTETWDDGSQHTVDVSLLDMNNDTMADEIQIVNDANTTMTATTLMQVTSMVTDTLGRPASMTAQVFSSTSGDGILQGSATFNGTVIQSVVVADGGSMPPAGTGGMILSGIMPNLDGTFTESIMSTNQLIGRTTKDVAGNLLYTDTYTYNGTQQTGSVRTDATGTLMFTQTNTYDTATGMRTGWLRTDASGNLLATQTNTYDTSGPTQIQTGVIRTNGSGNLIFTDTYLDPGFFGSGGTITFDGTTTVRDWSGNLLISGMIDRFDSMGKVISTVYTDGFGNLLSTDTYTYDAMGMTRIGFVNTDAAGNLLYTDTFTFGGATGTQQIGKTRTDANGALVFTQTNTYDAILTTKVTGWVRTDANGNLLATETRSFDAMGTLTGKERLGALGNLIFRDTYLSDGSTITFDGVTTTVRDWSGNLLISGMIDRFDSMGKMISTVYTDGFGNLLSTDTYTYDAMGMTRTGFVTTDASGNLLYTDTFTLGGATGTQQIGKTRTDANGALVFTQTNTYDAILTTKVTGWVRTDANGNLLATQTNIYDVMGMWVGSERTDASGNVVRSQTDIYDAYGNYMGYTTFDGIANTVAMYNADGQLVHSYTDLGGANDTFAGTSRNDSIRAGDGADTIVGGLGQDNIDLGETVAASDTVVINVGDSTPTGGASDLVSNFDVTSSLAVGNTNDVLDLPSNTIAANTAGVSGFTNLNTGSILSHSITNGMISFDDASTFGSALVVGDMTNWSQVKNYMMANIANGETVATYIDMNGNGLYTDVADRLAVFQSNATMDVQVQLYDTMGMVTALSNIAQMNSVTII